MFFNGIVVRIIIFISIIFFAFISCTSLDKTIEKQIGIEMYCNGDEEIIVIISNTYGPVKPKKAGVTVMSTKGNDRGHGLLLVRTIIASNKMFENETEITNDLYIQKLIIKKQEDK